MMERFDFYGMIYLCLEATRDHIKSNNNLPRGVAMVMMFPGSAQFFRAVKRAHHVLMTCHLLSSRPGGLTSATLKMDHKMTIRVSDYSVA